MPFRKTTSLIAWISIIALLLGNFSFIKISAAADPNQYNLSSDWRWTPSSASGAATITNALLNDVDSGSLSIASGGSEELILSLDAAPEGGIFTYVLEGADQTAWTISASESFDSTNGQDGSWNSLATSLPGDENGPSSRLRHVNLSESANARWFKFSITNNYSSAQALATVGLHKFNGNNDYWLFVGASIVNMSIDYDEMNSQIKTNYGYDPLIFNMGNSGKTVSWLNDNIETIMSAHPKAKFVAIHMGGNNVSNNRPYATAEQSALDSFDVNYRELLQKIQSAGKIAVPGRLTFRNYPHDYPDKPGVYDGGMEHNGSLPFNVNLLDPIIASMTPEFYDATAGRGAVDLYTYFLNNQWALEGTDGVHPNTLGRDLFYQIWIDTAFEFVYDGTLPTAITPQTFNTPAEDAEELVSAAEASRETSDINVAQSKLDELDYWPEFSVEQSLLQIRLDNVVPTTALVYNVDFGASTYLSSPNWNNLNGITVGSNINLISDSGASSSINLAVTKSFTSTTGSGLTFSDFPYSATRDSFVVRTYTGTSSSITLSGLNPEKKYTFTIYSSGSATSSVTDFTINGVTNSVTSGGNNSQVVQFNNIIPDQDEEIDIFVFTATNYGYFNAMQIRETENPPTCFDHILNQDEVAVDVGGVCGTAVTLTYSAASHGSLTGTTTQVINSGSDGSPVTAVPDSGYHFVDWSDGSTENPRTDANVTANKSLTANFAVDTYTLTYSAGSHGSLSGATIQVVNGGSNGSAVTAIADSGYHFVDWSDGSTQNPRTDTNVTANKSVSANFAFTVETCFDGIQNQNETGVDSGGVCVSRAYFIDFGATTTTDWNNVTTHQVGMKNQNIFDSEGATSTIDISIEDDFSSLGASGVSTTTGIYPANVIIDYFYVQSGSVAVVKFSSLDLNNSYSFKILPSRSGTGTRNSEYIINGVSVVVNAMNNVSNVAEFTNIEPDINGEINITIQPEAGASYAYLNAIELVENMGADTYALAYSASSYGSIRGEATQVVNNKSDGSAVIAVPNSGYHFIGWSDGSTDNPRIDTHVTENKSVVANFSLNTETCFDGIKNQNESSIDFGGICVSRNYFIDFGDLTTVGWNNMTDSQIGTNKQDIFDSEGASSTIDINVEAAFSGFSGYGVSTTTGIYPSRVISDYFFVEDGSFAVLKFSDLDINNFYSVKLFPSRSGTGTRNSEYIINGSSVFVNAMDNISNLGIFYGVQPNVDGEIFVTVRPESGASYAYLNAIELVESVSASNFILDYTASLNGSLLGTVTQIINRGSNSSPVTAVPDTGYHFVDWSDGSTQNPRTDTNVSADKSVTANFALDAPLTYTLNYSAGSHGSLSGTTTQVVNSGADGSAVTAVPDSGYHFVDWSDGSTQNPRTDTNVTANKSVSANFALDAPLTYTLNYSAGSHGSLSGTTTQVVNSEADGSAVTAVPDSGYHFVDWSDGSTQNPRTDTNVTSNKSVSANFAISQYTISFNSNGGSLINDITDDYGAVITAPSNPTRIGYIFTGWSPSLPANMPAGNQTYAALWAPIEEDNATSSISFFTPSGIGSGERDVVAGVGAVIGATLEAGEIDAGGTNILTYITNRNNFSAPQSSNNWQLESHHFIISDLDLFNNVAKLTFYSEPKVLNLNLGESKKVDLDNDSIADIVVTFTDIYINRAEITLQSLDKEESLQVGEQSSNNYYKEVITRERELSKTVNPLLAQRLAGRLLLQTEERGQAWYVDVVSKNRYYLGKPHDAFNIIKTLGLGVSEKDYKQISSGVIPSRLAGRIILRVEKNGEAYYINPRNFQLYYLGRPADAHKLLHDLALGISNDNIRQIKVAN